MRLNYKAWYFMILLLKIWMELRIFYIFCWVIYLQGQQFLILSCRCFYFSCAHFVYIFVFLSNEFWIWYRMKFNKFFVRIHSTVCPKKEYSSLNWYFEKTICFKVLWKRVLNLILDMLYFSGLFSICKSSCTVVISRSFCFSLKVKIQDRTQNVQP